MAQPQLYDPIRRELERKRHRMMQEGMERGFQDPIVLKLSQELDQLHNQIIMKA
ncbi:Spo0E family sporulation regulatory protein-aspartic acid phosphatase [Thalassobacillus hwangdonensis]|uniref:Spo0E family sporulation regulatory protein-aspartic acid phosphatase n=1 Tax=Thalassobacillus hwangdonensis TaxID=546108 RepID=A0ABW3L4T4_9BACI